MNRNSEPKVTTALLQSQTSRPPCYGSMNFVGIAEIIFGLASVALQVFSIILIGQHNYDDYFAGIWVGIWLIAAGVVTIFWSYYRQKCCMFGMHLTFSTIAVICSIIAGFLFFSIMGRYNRMVCFSDWSKNVGISWSNDDDYDNYEEFYEKYYKEYVDGTSEINKELERNLQHTPPEEWKRIFDDECRKIEYGKMFYTSLGILMVVEVMVGLVSTLYAMVICGTIGSSQKGYHGDQEVITVVYQNGDTEFQRDDRNMFHQKIQQNYSNGQDYGYAAPQNSFNCPVVAPSAPPLDTCYSNHYIQPLIK